MAAFLCRNCGHRHTDWDVTSHEACHACGRRPVTREDDEKYARDLQNYDAPPAATIPLAEMSEVTGELFEAAPEHDGHVFADDADNPLTFGSSDSAFDGGGSSDSIDTSAPDTFDGGYL